jgi:hypothetical protein
MALASDLVLGASTVQRILMAAKIPSAVVGGIAVAVWGEPRLTRDADLKVLLDRDQHRRLLDALPDSWRPIADAPEDTLRRLGILFLLGPENVRVDLLLGETAFDASAISRATDVAMDGGTDLGVCTAEDVIIYKLLSTRPRDREDVMSVIRRQAGSLDDDYVLHWLRQFEAALDDSTLVASYRQLRLDLR